MKRWLILTSLVLNGVLTLVILGLAAFGRKQEAVVKPQVATVQAPALPLLVQNSEKATQPAAHFHWSHLETPDFSLYVRNLRQIGCPEATIRDIVAGELQEIYDQKYQALSQHTANSALQGVTPAGAAVAAKDSLRKLQLEKEQALAGLLRPSFEQSASSSSPVVMDASATPSIATSSPAFAVENSQPVASNVQIPAAFSVGNAPTDQPDSRAEISTVVTDPNLDPVTAQTITRMREDFAKSLGETAKDPSSGDYLKNWNRARFQSNDRFSSTYGGDAFIRLNLQKGRAAAAAAAAP